MYKLRIYRKNGSLDHEEIFDTKEEMVKGYNKLFKHENYSLNPTVWENVNGEWCRLEGY